MRRFFISITLLICLVLNLSAASGLGREGPEDFRLELTGSAWLSGPTGRIQADGTPIDFVSDLAASHREPQFYGRLIFKAGRRHRLIVEGSPVSFSGTNSISRSIVFLNRTYSVSQTVDTKANVNYAFGGYQYDPISNSYGHLGLQVGVAYFGVNGTLHGVESGLSETKSAQAPVPLMGTEFRVFPVRHRKLLQFEGMLRGLPAGGYGYFIEGSASGGLRVGPISALAGYREMFANIHENNQVGNGVAMHLKGPVFSLQWQW